MNGQIGAADYAVFLAFFALSFGLMQSIVLAQRHLADGQGSLRLVGLAVMISAILFAALMVMPIAGWGYRLAGIAAFGVLITGLALLSVVSPTRRFGPSSALKLILVGTLVLKAYDALR